MEKTQIGCFWIFRSATEKPPAEVEHQEHVDEQQKSFHVVQRDVLMVLSMMRSSIADLTGRSATGPRFL